VSILGAWGEKLSSKSKYEVPLTVAQLRTLKTGASVGTTSSTTLSHQHDITITCL
jgi:hypothetical protein